MALKTEASPAHRASESRWRFLPLAVILAGLGLALAFGLPNALSLESFLETRQALQRMVDDHLLVASLVYVAVYTIAVAFIFPAPLVLTIAGGFLFGWWLGGLLTVVGATAGAAVLFKATQTAFGSFLRRKAGPAIGRFAEGFERDAFSYLLVLRLTPVLPFAVLNIGPALLGMSLRSFVLATFIGIVPGALVYAFVGSGIDSALAAAGKTATLAIDDLVTWQVTAALFALAALSLLGLVLKKWVLGVRPRASREAS
ncbi:TVP38/TMEM64 family protein [Consotaella aegiceratis]|uniref:TVP38/TMEM64 family protein n=1 Tax=Consotaella aegiceratis TaxID=3097961 RepID=UPI002F3F4CA3